MVIVVSVGHKRKPMEDHTAGRRGLGRGTFFKLRGNSRGRGRAGGQLEPEIMVKIGVDTPSRLEGDVATFEHMRGFHVAHTEYDQQMKITKKNVGGRVLARRRDLVD